MSKFKGIGFLEGNETLVEVLNSSEVGVSPWDELLEKWKAPTAFFFSLRLIGTVH
jgi:hypothetical protein